ncbi:MAG: 2-hydroxyacid dehydrogenase [Candidatus Hydrogenedentota bacterium]
MVPASRAESFADLRGQYPRIEFVTYNGLGDAVDRVADCDAFIGDPNDALLKAGVKLRWVQAFHAGVEHFIDAPSLRDRDVVVTNCKIIMGPQLADHVFALLLSLTRNMRFYTKGMDEEKWDRFSGMPLLELRGKTMLIIGLGGAGTQTADRAKAFGMRVLAVDTKDMPYSHNVDYCGKPDELRKLLPEADVVASCVPLTDESRHVLGAEEFALMKDGALVINISRGGVIDTEALTAALEAGKLGGAGLDVTEPEPLPAGHPLWERPNVIITPHIAGFSDGRDLRIKEMIRENIARFAQGLPLKNVVNIREGY